MDPDKLPTMDDLRGAPVLLSYHEVRVVDNVASFYWAPHLGVFYSVVSFDVYMYLVNAAATVRLTLPRTASRKGFRVG